MGVFLTAKGGGAMPSVDQKMPLGGRNFPFGVLDKPDLAAEISELRKDIAELRAQLVPVPSLIATGREVIDAFNAIAKAQRNG